MQELSHWAPGGWRRLLPPEQTVSEKRPVRDWCHLHPRLSSCEKRPWVDLWIYTSHGREMIDHGPWESSNECSFMSGGGDDNTDYAVMVTVNAHWVTSALMRAHVITSTFAGKPKIWVVHWLDVYHVACCVLDIKSPHHFTQVYNICSDNYNYWIIQ